MTAIPPSTDTDTEPARRRGPVRAFLETRGLVGGHEAAHEHLDLVAADGTRLVATHLPGPDASAPAVVLVHGFAAHRRKPAYAQLADRLSRSVHVVAVDLRGHGDSGGRCTLGDREALDVEAAVVWLRAKGHERVVVVGASMGATSLLHALARGTEATAAVAISGPARLDEEPATAAMQRLRRVWQSRVARTILHVGLGVRVVPPSRWRHPGHPHVFAGEIGVPLLVVHGVDDGYFPLADAEVLAAAAPTGTLWVEPDGFGHAEDGFTDGFADRLSRAVLAVADHGRFPERDEVHA